MKQVSFESMAPLIEEALSNGKTITISVTGVSMAPTLRPRDAVTLERVPLTELERGDIVLYRRKNGQFVMHRIVRVDNDCFDLCGDAQTVVERLVPSSAIIGRVVSYEKDGVVTQRAQILKIGRRRLRSRVLRRGTSFINRLFGHEEKDPLLTPVSFVLGYLRQYTFQIILLCVLSGISAAAMLGMALVSGRVIDKAFYNDMQHFSGWFCLLFVLLGVVVLSNFVYGNLSARIMMRLRNGMREDIFKQLLDKRYHDVQSLHSGDILNRMTSDIYLVSDSLVSLVPQLFSLVIKLLGALMFMMTVDPTFTVIVIVGAVIVGALLQFFSRMFKRLHKQCQEAEGKSRSFLQECVENLVVVKSFNNEDGVLETFEKYQEQVYRKFARRSTVSAFGSSMVYFSFSMAYYAALAWGILRVAGWFGAAATMSLGTFTSLLQVMEQIRNPFRSASGLLPQYYSMIASAERLQSLTLLRNENRHDHGMDVAKIYEHLAHLQFNDVTFAYERGRYVYRHANLRFRRGDLTAIVGPSGSGKSTLIKLLLGLVNVQEGSVEMVLDTGSIIPVSASTRELFSYVPQGNMILSGTIRENICFGNDSVSDNEIERALRLACLDETVNNLPNGLSTVIGERGIGLSEGQIQRLAIARALLSRSPILLLDECTSALDMETEERLIRHLKELDDHTILFISHRAAVLDNADAILSIDDLKRKGV